MQDATIANLMCEGVRAAFYTARQKTVGDKGAQQSLVKKTQLFSTSEITDFYSLGAKQAGLNQYTL